MFARKQAYLYQNARGYVQVVSRGITWLRADVWPPGKGPCPVQFARAGKCVGCRGSDPRECISVSCQSLLTFLRSRRADSKLT
jgi:hypothetical protein